MTKLLQWDWRGAERTSKLHRQKKQLAYHFLFLSLWAEDECAVGETA